MISLDDNVIYDSYPIYSFKDSKNIHWFHELNYINDYFWELHCLYLPINQNFLRKNFLIYRWINILRDI